MTARISVADLDAAIIGYLPSLDKAQKEAVLNFLKAFVPVPDGGDHWDDPAFVAEMDKRYEDYKNNPEQMKSLDEVMEGIGKMLQENRQLGNEQKAVTFNLVEAFTPAPEAGSHWDDPDFVAEMNRRYEDYKSGKNIVSFEDIKSAMDYLKSGVKK